MIFCLIKDSRRELQSMIDHGNAMVLRFSSYAGGKFLSNCLSLSRHACPQNIAAVNHLLDHPNDYDYRLKCVLSSLPGPVDMKRWRKFEFGDDIYGPAYRAWLEGRSPPLDQRTQRLIDSGMMFFIVCHSMTLSGVEKVFPRGRCIKLVNHYRFQQLAVSLKSDAEYSAESFNGNFSESKYQVLAGADWPQWKDFELSGYNIDAIPNVPLHIQDEIRSFYPVVSVPGELIFDVDGTYFDFAEFAPAVDRIYQALGFDDFNRDLLEIFHKRYMDLHKERS